MTDSVSEPATQDSQGGDLSRWLSRCRADASAMREANVPALTECAQMVENLVNVAQSALARLDAIERATRGL